MVSHHAVEAGRESDGQFGDRRAWSHVPPEVPGMEQRVVQKADYKDISRELADPSLLPGRLALCSIWQLRSPKVWEDVYYLRFLLMQEQDKVSGLMSHDPSL